MVSRLHASGKLLHVPHAYYSRVSNRTVLERAGQKPLSEDLRNEQKKYYRELLDRELVDPVRGTIFSQTGQDLRPFPGRRRVGRPRLTWIASMECQ